jgi:hypothetical protein
MTKKQIEEKLNGKIDMLSKNREGNYIARRGFFYTNGMSADLLAKKIKEEIPEIAIVKTWEKWTPFKGGSSVKQGSHFGVEFKIL